MLVGIRKKTADCADSCLGYQCYADTDPETDYTGNLGAVLTMSYDRLMIGVRASSEST
ncbi:hypothetical protein [Paracoccus rhizosphaerae]|uniref:Uncharacterized protein n=1 Tax=Paracoccus rhizosphaerae TaxID=1133347 RepID=A0ABV6CP07_9RHOB|nr:hypothetical protein [Paracoccus rhizosphaerae]